MKTNKFEYKNVIQQNYGAYGWEDVSEYEANSTGKSINTALHSGTFVKTKTGRERELTLLAHDLKEYRLTGYPTRVIFRRELKN